MPFEIAKEKVDPERWWALKLTDSEFPAEYKRRHPWSDNLPVRESYLKSKHIRRPDEPDPAASAIASEYDRVSREEVQDIVKDAVAKAVAETLKLVNAGKEPVSELEEAREELSEAEPEEEPEPAPKKPNKRPPPPHTKEKHMCECGKVIVGRVGYVSHKKRCEVYQAKAAELELVEA